MLDDKALILIAHSDWRTLMALYTLLDAEGYFVAPCFTREDLLRYCEQYKPELVMTSDPLCNDSEGRLQESIRGRSPQSRVHLLADVLIEESTRAFFDPVRLKEILGAAEAVPVPDPVFHVNGF